MKVFKDVFTGDELFSDTYKMKLVDNCVWEVYGKVRVLFTLSANFSPCLLIPPKDLFTGHPRCSGYETRKEGEVVLEGANASAEGGDDDGTDDSSVSGIDVVLNHRLTETGFGSKKDFTVYLKEYMKRVIKYLEDNDRGAEVDEFKKNINNVMKDILGRFKDLQFFTGESMDPDAMICMAEYKEVDGEERPVLYFFKHGLEEEKC